jgi:hypothetical protein
MSSWVVAQPQAVSTVTAIPQTPHVYLLPFGMAAFFTAFFAAGFATVLAAGLAAGFAAAFAIGAGFFAAGFLAAGFAAAFAAGFAAGLLFVAIVLPPFAFFYCFNTFILCILNI